jgi:hypothetical protein
MNWGKSWADGHIAALKRGETVSFRPHGRSMEPLIKSGALCTVESVDIVVHPSEVKAGDVVLCRVGNAQYLHLVKAIRFAGANRGAELQIGNNKGGVNGWIPPADVYGKLVKVEA